MTKLSDVIQFRGDRLFNGAVSLDWLWSNPESSSAATEAYIFHGPAYHGVDQQDIGIEHEHRLQDTATFTRSIVRRCHGIEESPFTLAIAGYGTGKSHLALALANFFQQPRSELAKTLLSRIEEADSTIGAEVQALVREEPRPFLTVALNGMQNFDLTAEVTRQIIIQAQAHGLDTQALDELRPRFKQAANLVNMASEKMVGNLIEACAVDDVDEILEALNEQDEGVYAKVQGILESVGLPIRSFGGETIKDVIDVAVHAYCGEGKPFAGLVILFDEFGRYTEFATIRSQVAGSGVLQDLFEGVQGNSGSVTFVGFIQFELNAYVQRVAPEFKNEILRYVSRYQSASKSYLSINLETLVANLIEKKDPELLDKWFDKKESRQHSREIIQQLHKWFPQSQNHQLWTDKERFHRIVYKGCWPLSPFAMWMLFQLTSAGKHLQERSALTLLGESLQRVSQTEFSGVDSWSLSPIDLWSDSLQEELLSSEELGRQGSITHAYVSAISKYGSQLPSSANKILRSIVLAAKLGLYVESRDEAIYALAELGGMPQAQVDTDVQRLQDEYNVIDWDGNFNQFDILGDAVPRSQFLAYLRQKIADGYDDQGKASLFATRSQEWCDLLGDLDCDFAEQNRIATQDWQFKAVTTYFQLLETQIKFSIGEWQESFAINDPKGLVFYCYVEPGRDAKATALEVRKLIRSVEKEVGFSPLPVFVVLLCDEDGELGQTLAEMAVLLEGISDEERAKFENLIAAQIEKAQKIIKHQIESMLRAQHFITSLGDELQPARRNRFGSELFARVYKKPIPFPFDGFSTARGNAADTCYRLIIELLHGKLDFDTVTAKPPKEKNRAIRVLSDTWDIFTSRGAVSRKPENSTVRSVFERWDRELKEDKSRFFIGQAIRRLCLPPHGANIASASLLFAVYVASRAESLLIARKDQVFGINQWVQEGIFRGKYLDLKTIDTDALLPAGGDSSEWDDLLSDWEQAESYMEQARYLEKAAELQQRIPIPPARRDRFALLAERSSEAQSAMEQMERDTEKAMRKMQKAYERADLSILSWGAASLVEIQQRMVREQPFWTQEQINALIKDIEQGRQAVIEMFPEWLSSQHPPDDRPDTVGEFKHKMLTNVGGNLKTLGLDDHIQQLQERVNYLVRNAENASEARQLLHAVNNWIDEHNEALRIPRVTEIRGLKEVAKEYANKLRTMSQKIDMQELQEARSKLAEFTETLKAAETKIMERAGALWDSEIRCEKDLEHIMREVQSVITAFEGLEADQEDMILMERALEDFQKGCRRLTNEKITWDEFTAISSEWRQYMINEFGEEELPWDIEATISNLCEEKGEYRKSMSESWITELEDAWNALKTPTTAEASRIYEKALDPPDFVTAAHRERTSQILSQVEAQLETLKVEWLVEKFKEMPSQTQKDFLEIVMAIQRGNNF